MLNKFISHLGLLFCKLFVFVPFCYSSVWELFILFRYEEFYKSHIHCKYFLPVCDLSFNFILISFMQHRFLILSNCQYFPVLCLVFEILSYPEVINSPIVFKSLKVFLFIFKSYSFETYFINSVRMHRFNFSHVANNCPDIIYWVVLSFNPEL